MSHWLIRRAAQSVPESLSQRLEEEWLADLAARPSSLSRLRLAVGCCWATRVIVHEHQPLSVAVAGPVVGARLMNAYAQHNVGQFSRRSSTLFLVVLLHAALFYGLVTTLSHTHGGVIPTPLQNQLVKTPRLPQLPLPLPPPQLREPTIVVPKPDFDVAREADPVRDVTTDVIQEPSPPPVPPSPAHVVKQVQGGPGAGFPNPDDFYPSLARVQEQQGVATVRVCVDAHGRLTSDPTTVQSTGSSQLDDGALKLAKAGSGHYRASTEDGRPVNSCYPFRIRFQLRN